MRRLPDPEQSIQVILNFQPFPTFCFTSTADSTLVCAVLCLRTPTLQGYTTAGAHTDPEKGDVRFLVDDRQEHQT